jgi:hypothetical protein
MKGTMKRSIALSLVLAALAASAIALLPVEATALCMAQAEDGNWANTNANTRSLTRIELEFICQDVIANGQLSPPGAPWYMHVYGKCHPTDCDWGRVDAQRLGTGHVFATYNHGFAKRFVFARMSQYRAGQLWVYTWTDFTAADGRPDYGTHNWFVRQ